MRTEERWLIVLGTGSILAFAVTVTTPVFNVHIAGYVIMAVAILGLLIPARASSSLWGWRRSRERTQRWPVAAIDDTRPSYVVRNPDDVNAPQSARRGNSR